MANDVSQPYVLVLDTAADNIVAAGTQVNVMKIRLVTAAAAATATLCKAGGTVGVIGLAAGAGFSDVIEFEQAPMKLAGLRLLALAGAGAVVYVYTEQA